MPGTLLRFKNAQSVSIASYFGCRSLCKDTGLKIQSGFREATISISGDMAVPTVVKSLYLSGMVETVLLHTPTKSSSNLSQISAVAGEVAIILGVSFMAATFFFAASTAAFSFGSLISNKVLASVASSLVRLSEAVDLSDCPSSSVSLSDITDSAAAALSLLLFCPWL